MASIFIATDLYAEISNDSSLRKYVYAIFNLDNMFYDLQNGVFHNTFNIPNSISCNLCCVSVTRNTTSLKSVKIKSQSLHNCNVLVFVVVKLWFIEVGKVDVCRRPFTQK